MVAVPGVGVVEVDAVPLLDLDDGVSPHQARSRGCTGRVDGDGCAGPAGGRVDRHEWWPAEAVTYSVFMSQLRDDMLRRGRPALNDDPPPSSTGRRRPRCRHRSAPRTARRRSDLGTGDGRRELVGAGLPSRRSRRRAAPSPVRPSRSGRPPSCRPGSWAWWWRRRCCCPRSMPTSPAPTDGDDVPPDDVHAARNASAATTAVSAARRGREPGTAPNANRGGPPATRHGHRSCVVPAPAAGRPARPRRELGRL